LRIQTRFVGALALTLSFVAAARAEDLRSDEGFSIPVPEGWTRTTQKLNATTAIALERTDAGDPHPRIAINTLPVQTVTEERAFQIVREMLDRPGEVVERTKGRFLKEEFDDDGPAGKLKHRAYAALRNKRIYFLILETPATRFEKDAPALEQLVDAVAFFVPEPKPESKPEPKPEPKKVEPSPAPPQTAPVASPTEVVRASPSPAPPANTALTSSSDADTAKPTETKIAPPDAAPVTTPAAPKSPVVRRPQTTNLLGPGALVAFDDEYDPEIWAAKHLVDAAARNGWCSSPTRRGPHRFVLELRQPTDVARLAFDDACPEESGFEGAAAREVSIEGSSVGPLGPWRELGRAILEKGKNDQPVDLVPNDGRWLRVSLISNHGHPVLTQLVRIRAFPAEAVAAGPSSAPVVTTDEGPFRLERVRFTRTRENHEVPLDPAVVGPGDSLYVYFKPRAMQLSALGEYALDVDFRFEDFKGEEQHATVKTVHGRPPAPPLSTFVSVKVELPPTFPPGLYTLRIIAHDRESLKETREKLTFEVKKP
jgi:hypothetical protein